MKRYLPACYRRHICGDQAVCDGFFADAVKAKDAKMAEIRLCFCFMPEKRRKRGGKA